MALMIAIALIALVAISFSISAVTAIAGLVLLSLACEPVAGWYIERRARVAARPQIPRARVRRR